MSFAASYIAILSEDSQESTKSWELEVERRRQKSLASHVILSRKPGRAVILETQVEWG